MSKYKKVLKKKEAYKRYDPRSGKKVKVPGHSQHYRVRIYRRISKKEAKKEFEKRSKRSQAIDKAFRSKKTLDIPTEEWSGNQNKIDLEGIDTPEDWISDWKKRAKQQEAIEKAPIKNKKTRDPYDINTIVSHLMDDIYKYDKQDTPFYESIEDRYKKETKKKIERVRDLPKGKRHIMETILSMEYPPSKKTLTKINNLLDEKGDIYVTEKPNRGSATLFTIRRWIDEEGNIYIQDSIREKFYRVNDTKTLPIVRQGFRGNIKGEYIKTLKVWNENQFSKLVYLHPSSNPLPKQPRKGRVYHKIIENKSGKRFISFEATGKEGFGKWKIIENKPIKEK